MNKKTLQYGIVVVVVLTIFSRFSSNNTPMNDLAPSVVLTGGTDVETWEEIGSLLAGASSEWFRANVKLISESRFFDKSSDEVQELLGDDYPTDFVFIVDPTTLAHDEHPVLVVDFFDEPQEFRAGGPERFCFLGRQSRQESVTAKARFPIAVSHVYAAPREGGPS